MKHARWVVAALIFAGWVAFEIATDSIGVFVAAQAVTYIGFEQITVDNTAGGKSFTATKVEPSGSGAFPQATTARCRLRTAEISFTYDGTAPTTTVGQLLEVGDYLEITGHDNIMRFRAIRTGASSGQLDCVYTME